MSGKEVNFRSEKRRDRLVRQSSHDPYRQHSKYPDSCQCEHCGVAYLSGRWQWTDDLLIKANPVVCPACQRTRQRVPPGYLTLTGDCLKLDKNEILRLIHNKVDEQKAQHPLKRLIAIEENDQGELLLTFTDIHMPHSIGEAVQRACKGEFSVRYVKEEDSARAYWKRNQV